MKRKGVNLSDRGGCRTGTGRHRTLMFGRWVLGSNLNPRTEREGGINLRQRFETVYGRGGV